jgi:hypothetical protein
MSDSTSVGSNGRRRSSELGHGLKRKADDLEGADKQPSKHRQDGGSLSIGGPAGQNYAPVVTVDASMRRSDQVIRSRSSATPSEGLSQHMIAGVHPHIPHALPHDKVFPIQIGTELFKPSGASLSSDSPSYFSTFFAQQLSENPDAPLRTLYIDRDPETFRNIMLHLQGYHVTPQNGYQFIKLFADAQFYSLPRLLNQLFESEIFIKIGERDFRIPRDIFSTPGDSPNFFTLGFSNFFTTPTEVFPGLEPSNLLRPPAIHPPAVPNRSAEVFEDLLYLLRGYELHIRDEEHRSALVRDCRYYHLRGLEQKLTKCRIGLNRYHDTPEPLGEIWLRLEDVKPHAIVPKFDEEDFYFVQYTRPFTDDTPRNLIIEISGNDIGFLKEWDSTVQFNETVVSKLKSILKSASKKLQFETDANNLDVMLVYTDDSAVTIDGTRCEYVAKEDTVENSEWTLHKGQWQVCLSKIGKSLVFNFQTIHMEATSTYEKRAAYFGYLS